MNKILKIDLLGDKRLIKEIIDIMNQRNFLFNIISEKKGKLHNFGMVSFSTVDINLIDFWNKNIKNKNLMVDIKIDVGGIVIDRTTYDMGNRIYLPSKCSIIEYYYRKNKIFDNRINEIDDLDDIVKMYHSGDIEQKQKACEKMISKLDCFVRSIIDNQHPDSKDNYDDMVNVAYLAILDSIPSYNPKIKTPESYFYLPIFWQLQEFIGTVTDLQKINF